MCYREHIFLQILLVFIENLCLYIVAISNFHTIYCGYIYQSEERITLETQE